jgi:hypothetical protein
MKFNLGGSWWHHKAVAIADDLGRQRQDTASHKQRVYLDDKIRVICMRPKYGNAHPDTEIRVRLQDEEITVFKGSLFSTEIHVGGAWGAYVNAKFTEAREKVKAREDAIKLRRKRQEEREKEEAQKFQAKLDSVFA